MIASTELSRMAVNWYSCDKAISGNTFTPIVGLNSLPKDEE